MWANIHTHAHTLLLLQIPLQLLLLLVWLGKQTNALIYSYVLSNYLLGYVIFQSTFVDQASCCANTQVKTPVSRISETRWIILLRLQYPILIGLHFITLKQPMLPKCKPFPVDSQNPLNLGAIENRMIISGLRGRFSLPTRVTATNKDKKDNQSIDSKTKFGRDVSGAVWYYTLA